MVGVRGGIAFAFALVLATSHAMAQDAYRCTAADGKVTYQQAPCPKASTETKVDTTPANPSYDPAKREQILREGAEAGRKLEARAAKEEEERRRREEQRAREEQLLREAQEREEAREYPNYYAWPPGSRPPWGGFKPKPPTPPGPRPQPLAPGK